jgi:hypothetical protein
MTTRQAACGCGQLTATCEGEPVRISVCHCLDCKRRSGSAFAAQARWPHERVQISGQFREWVRISDEGNKAAFRFCPTCGSTVYYELSSMPDVIAVAIGAFADPKFPPPLYSVYEDRQHAWVKVDADEHYA